MSSKASEPYYAACKILKESATRYFIAWDENQETGEERGNS